MPSAKYVIVMQHLPHDFLAVPTVAGVPSPKKANFDALRAKVDEMISAGKMVKGTLGTKSHPEHPGGELYVAPEAVALAGFGDVTPNHPTKIYIYTDRIRPWVHNLVINHDPVTNTLDMDYPSGRVVPEAWKAMRVLKKEYAQEWIDYLLSIGAEYAQIISEEEVAAIAPNMVLPDDDNIDTHVEGTGA
jgi:hypothetical protein